MDSLSGIAKCQLDVTFLLGYFQFNCTFWRCKLESIRQQIIDDLLQFVLIHQQVLTFIRLIIQDKLNSIFCFKVIKATNQVLQEQV